VPIHVAVRAFADQSSVAHLYTLTLSKKRPSLSPRSDMPRSSLQDPLLQNFSYYSQTCYNPPLGGYIIENGAHECQLHPHGAILRLSADFFGICLAAQWQGVKTSNTPAKLRWLSRSQSNAASGATTEDRAVRTRHDRPLLGAVGDQD